MVTSSYEMKTNLTVSNLLHGVDIVLGMTWLKVADPLIRWSTGQMYILDSRVFVSADHGSVAREAG